MRSICRISLTLLLVAALTPGVYAQGKGKGHGKPGPATGTLANTPGSGHSGDHGPGTTPPGYEKGKKTGWGDCDVPPGQAKPLHCNQAREKSKEHKDKAKDKANKHKAKNKS